MSSTSIISTYLIWPTKVQILHQTALKALASFFLYETSSVGVTLAETLANMSMEDSGIDYLVTDLKRHMPGFIPSSSDDVHYLTYFGELTFDHLGLRRSTRLVKRH